MERKPLLEPSDSVENSEEEIELTPFSVKSRSAPKGNQTITFNQLIKVVKAGDLQSIQNVLNKRNIQISDLGGRTILHVAAEVKSKAVMGELLRHSQCWSLLNRQNMMGVTPLMTALMARNYPVLDLLCAKGADPCLAQAKNGKTILHLAVLLSDVKGATILLKHNTDNHFINLLDIKGDPALTEAVHFNPEVFELLLDAGADITLKHPESGRTVLHVAVAYNKNKMVNRILSHPNATFDFVNVKDVEGDSSLIIAVKLQNLHIVKSFTNKFNSLNGINQKESMSVFHICIENNRADILALLLEHVEPNTLYYQDSKQRSPLFYAAELDSASCLKKLMKSGSDYFEKSPMTGETILHVVARCHSHSTIPFLMSQIHIAWFFLQKDFQGNTPYMIAIKSGNDTFLKETFIVKKVDLCEYSQTGETVPFYCIRQGYLKVLHILLLSPKCYAFARRKRHSINLHDPDVLSLAEIRGDIYATDLYLLTRKVVTKQLVPYFPPHLLMKTKNNNNVFHACSLSGNIQCLKFLYEFFRLFGPKYFIGDLDAPGMNGNTPLLIAALRGRLSKFCVEFFVTHGADLTSTNNKGVSAIEAILAYNTDSPGTFIKLLNNCVTSKKEYYNLDRPNIYVDFGTLCPKGKRQMSVVNMLFDKTCGDQRTRILQHPVIVLFIKRKVVGAKCLFYMHYIGQLVSTFIITVIVTTIYIGDSHPLEKFSFRYYVYQSICIFAIVGYAFLFLLKIPFILMNSLWISDFIVIIPPLSTTFLLICSRTNYLFPEISACSILSSWVCLLVFSINMHSTYSYHIAMFFNLLKNICRQLPVLFIVVFAFSISFFCMYHTNKSFSSVSSSIIYTWTVMLHASPTVVPTFEKGNFRNASLLSVRFWVECFVLLLFIIIVSKSFVNMLIGLAVRGGKTLQEDGKIFQNHHAAHYMLIIDYWFDNPIYYKLIKANQRIKKFLLNQKKKTLISNVCNINDKEIKLLCDDEMLRNFNDIIFEKKRRNDQKEKSKEFQDSLEDLFRPMEENKDFEDK